MPVCMVKLMKWRLPSKRGLESRARCIRRVRQTHDLHTKGVAVCSHVRWAECDEVQTRAIVPACLRMQLSFESHAPETPHEIFVPKLNAVVVLDEKRPRARPPRADEWRFLCRNVSVFLAPSCHVEAHTRLEV